MGVAAEVAVEAAEAAMVAEARWAHTPIIK